MFFHKRVVYYNYHFTGRSLSGQPISAIPGLLFWTISIATRFSSKKLLQDFLVTFYLNGLKHLRSHQGHFNDTGAKQLITNPLTFILSISMVKMRLLIFPFPLLCFSFQDGAFFNNCCQFADQQFLPICGPTIPANSSYIQMKS